MDAIETNTFGANLANLGEYDIPERIHELAEAGARIAREAADHWSADSRPRFVLGSMGPGTKLPSLGHAPYAALRDAYAEQARGLVAGGADAFLIETSQDLLQAKAAVVGCKRALAEAGESLPILVQVTVETTGTMLLGSEIGAALTALEPLGIDAIGLNCATGPTEMSEHLRHLSRNARIAVTCMPNAGLPMLTKEGAAYPLTPAELAKAHTQFVEEFGLALVGGCCGTTPEHLRQVVEAVGGAPVKARRPRSEAAVASLYQTVPFRQDASYLSIGERTNANGSKAFREAMLEGRWDNCVEIARDQTRDGAHLLDVCVDYVGRDGVDDMKQVVSRLATSSTLPLVLDSTEPPVIEAGLEMLGGRAVINSVNFEDGDGPDSRYQRMMRLVQEHGAAVVALTIDEEGQARTSDKKVAIASRLIDALTGEWGMQCRGHHRRHAHLPDRHRSGGDPPRRPGDHRGDPRDQAALPRGADDPRRLNVSFGLSPAARIVLNSVFLHECVKAGLDSAIVHAAKILPMNRIPEERRDVALDLIYDRRREGYDPLERFLDIFSGVDAGLDEGLEGRRAPGAAARGAPGPPHHRRRAQGPRGGPAGLPRQGHRAARHHQRLPARRHEDRGRAVRPGRDAAAVRAAVGRDDEGGRCVPRAASSRSSSAAASARRRPGCCSPPSRATSTTSARTSWTSSCRTTATRWSTSASSSPSRRSSGRPTSTTWTPSACPACW